MKGPGQYDAECTTILLKTQAVGVLLIVVGGGDRGNGFSVSTTDPTFLRELPRILRECANEIESDVHRSGPDEPHE